MKLDKKKVDRSLIKIFKKTFKLNFVKENKLNYENLTNWDSLTHMDLMSSIEKKFKLQIEALYMPNLTSFIKIKKYIYSKKIK